MNVPSLVNVVAIFNVVLDVLYYCSNVVHTVYYAIAI